MTTQTKVGCWICRSIAVVFAVLEARGCWTHLQTEDWPVHAQFHSLTGFFYYLCLTIFFLYLTSKPFRDHNWFSWWAILLMGTFVHGSQVLVDLIEGGLRSGGTSQGSGSLFFGLAIAAYLLYIVAAVLTFKHFRSNSQLS